MNRREFARLCGAGLTGTTSLFRSSLLPAEQSSAQSMRTNLHDTFRLYGDRAGRSQGVGYLETPAVTPWIGESGTATWELNAPEASECEVSVCYAASAGGWKCELSVSGNKLAGDMVRTEGRYWDSRFNFERARLAGTLHLPAGPVSLTFRAWQEESYEVEEFWLPMRPAFVLRSVELTPVSAKPTIAAEQQLARKQRANTEWMSDAGYGVMFHWNSRSAPRHGSRKGYDDAVRDFDLNAFVEAVERSGAGYALVTTGWADPCCPAPIRSWERFFPGWTARRDLIAEVAEALGKRGIKFLLYFPSQTLGWGENYERLNEVSTVEFMDIHRQVLTEIGDRYGTGVAGYWLDGWGLVTVKFPDIPKEEFFHICKVGNPDRVFALSNWVFPLENPWQDYLAGDLGSIENPPASRYIEDGPGVGIQYHYCATLDEPNWAHESIETPMPHPRFTDARLVGYVKACMAQRVPVTLNMGIFQDGTPGEETLNQVQLLRRAIHGA